MLGIVIFYMSLLVSPLVYAKSSCEQGFCKGGAHHDLSNKEVRGKENNSSKPFFFAPLKDPYIALPELRELCHRACDEKQGVWSHIFDRGYGCVCHR